ncbi:hypothetical protein WA026_006800 [Henosepilachna vigintioctopunctata]|uniref:UDP-glucose:glycoprotein glucosyltransferase n=1 Tax=Henosepilachna vigintioctopunctata TaxID=420089 RepID=A0AAW1UI21_9CUCU
MKNLGKYFVYIFIFIFMVNAKNKKSKSVTTLLDAKWNTTPLLLEVAEYLADENVDFYWNFVDSVSKLNPPFNELGTDQSKYDTILKLAGKSITPAELEVLKLGLSLHIYSPKIQMFNQIASERNLNCQTIVDINGHLICDLEELKNYFQNDPLPKKGTVELFNVDTHFPGSQNRSDIAVFYGELGTNEFAKFHQVLAQKAEEGLVDYVIRHYVKIETGKKLRLSGYGVELQMKSTEYKAQDDAEIHDSPIEDASQEEEDSEIEGFDFSKLKKLFPNDHKNLDKFKQFLEETSNEMAPLKVWQFQELSLQAAERIMNAPKDESLKVFTNIAQNFPMLAKSLVKTTVKQELKKEIKNNQEIFSLSLNLQPQDTALFINGLFFDVDIIDVYGILDIVRQELRTMEGLNKIGISNEHLSALLSLDFNEAGSAQEFSIDIRDSAILWLNNIETDLKYSRWSSSLMELLRPTFPGMMRQVKKNLFNLVLIIDPTDTKALGLVKLIESFVVHTAPLRVGLIFRVNPDDGLTGLDDAGVAVQCAFNYVSQLKNPQSAISFLKNVMIFADNDIITVEDVKTQLKNEYNADIEDVLGSYSDYDFGRKLSNDFIQRLGQRSFPQALINGIPLPSSQMNVDDFEEAVLSEVMTQTQFFQKAVYRGKLSDVDDVIDYMMNQPNVMPRLNDRILNKEKSINLDMLGVPSSISNIPNLLKLSPRDMTATAMKNLKYFTVAKKNRKYHTVTYWVVGDLSCAKSRVILQAAIEHAKLESDVRVTFIPNVEGNGKNNLNKVVLSVLDNYPSDNALSYILDLLKNKDSLEIIQSGDFSNLPVEISSKLDAQDLNLKMLRVYCQRVLGLGIGHRAIVANGRILGPLGDEETFIEEDYSLFERFSSVQYLDKIITALSKETDETQEITSDSLLKIISLLVSKTQSKSRFEVKGNTEEHSVVKIPAARPEDVAFELVAIVDPVSRGAQKLSTILQVLHEVLNCNIKIFLNSAEKNSDMPLKSFYRFVLEKEIQFSEDGSQQSGPIARFSNMPTSPLLTQNYHVPENWLVEVVRSVYDLDNIRLENVDSNVHSEYELEYLLLEVIVSMLLLVAHQGSTNNSWYRKISCYCRYNCNGKFRLFPTEGQSWCLDI